MKNDVRFDMLDICEYCICTKCKTECEKSCKECDTMESNTLVTDCNNFDGISPKVELL